MLEQSAWIPSGNRVVNEAVFERPPAIRRCFQQQLKQLAWRRAQIVMDAAFEREKAALTASLIEHLEAGYDVDEFFETEA